MTLARTAHNWQAAGIAIAVAVVHHWSVRGRTRVMVTERIGRSPPPHCSPGVFAARLLGPFLFTCYNYVAADNAPFG